MNKPNMPDTNIELIIGVEIAELIVAANALFFYRPFVGPTPPPGGALFPRGRVPHPPAQAWKLRQPPGH